MVKITLRTYLEVKPMCIVCDGATVDGDVAFSKYSLGGYVGDFTHFWKFGNHGTLKNTYSAIERPPIKHFKIFMLWVWHMDILKKEHVYLTGVNK